MIFRFRIEQQIAPGRVAYHSRVLLNDSLDPPLWSSSPEPGGYRIGQEGRGFWQWRFEREGDPDLLLNDAVYRGRDLRPGAVVLILREISQQAIAGIIGTTGSGWLYRSQIAAFRGEILWRLTFSG